MVVREAETVPRGKDTIIMALRELLFICRWGTFLHGSEYEPQFSHSWKLGWYVCNERVSKKMFSWAPHPNLILSLG